MGIRVKFVADDAAEGIEVTVRAKERDAEVQKVLDLLDDRTRISCQPLSGERDVDWDDVVLISKNGRLLSVKTVNGEYVLNEPLYKIEERLDKNQFVRISQSEIVHLRYVLQWSLDGGGIIKIELINGIRSYTSRRYAPAIRKVLKQGGKRS